MKAKGPGVYAGALRFSCRLGNRLRSGALLLRREDLELTLRSRLRMSVAGRIAARAHEVCRLVIQSERLHRSDHGAAAAPSNEQRLFTHLPRQSSREWVS